MLYYPAFLVDRAREQDFARLRAELDATKARVQRLTDALKSVVDGNDLALERGHSIELWRDSPILKLARAALAEGEDIRG